MGKIKKAIIFSMLFLFSTSVKAETCGYEEKAKLNNEAANVKVNYEIKQGELDKNVYTPPDAIAGTEEEANWNPTYDYFQVNILNLTENIYVEVRNDQNNETTKYYYSNSQDGKIVIDWLNLENVTKFNITVKSTDASGCTDRTLKTLNLTLPRYNEYYLYGVCSNAPEYYLCQKYVTFDDIDFGYFVRKVSEEVERKNQEEIEKNLKWYEKAWNFIKDHKVAFITGGVIIVATGATITVVIIRKRRRSII